MPRPVQSLHRKSTISHLQHCLLLEVGDLDGGVMGQWGANIARQPITALVVRPDQIDDLPRQGIGQPLVVMLNSVQGEALCTVQAAAKRGAAGVGYHLQLGGRQEVEALVELEQVIRSARRMKLMVVVWLGWQREVPDPLWGYGVQLMADRKVDYVVVELPKTVSVQQVLRAAGGGNVVLRLEVSDSTSADNGY